MTVINYSTFLYPFTASAKAFDQYGEMVGRYEKQVELKERAEVLATEVTHNSMITANKTRLVFTQLSNKNNILERNVESLTQHGDAETKKLLVVRCCTM